MTGSASACTRPTPTPTPRSTGGRLVYLLPSLPDHTAAHLPVHPCLTLESDSEQPLTLMLSRSVVCMRKTAAYDASKRADYVAASEAAAAAAGLLGVSIRDRMGAAYDAWYEKHRTSEGDPALLHEKLYGNACNSRMVPTRPAAAGGAGVAAAGGAGAATAGAATAGAATADAAFVANGPTEAGVMTNKQVARHRKRLMRQMMRKGEAALEYTRSEGGDSEGHGGEAPSEE